MCNPQYVIKFIVCLFFLFGIINTINAQNFPNGTQILECCSCDDNCLLIADSNPTIFNTADLQKFILVDVNNDAVDGDDDDNLIDAITTTGAFDDIPIGDYVMYYITYAAVDEDIIEPYLEADASIDSLLALATQSGDNTWFATNPSFTLIATDLATIEDIEDCCICEDFQTVFEIECILPNFYAIYLSIIGGSSGENGYNIVNNLTGESFITTDHFVSLGTFTEQVEGYSYTVNVVDHPQCVDGAYSTFVTCVTTAVELQNFTGNVLREGNELLWTTASENESDYFIIEYGNDGESFNELATIKASGGSSVQNDYIYFHDIHKAGLAYYRLKEVDLNGNVKIVSNVVILERNINLLTITNVYPIPTSDNLHLNFLADVTQDVQINILDISGKAVLTKYHKAKRGENEVILNIQDLHANTYFISLSNEKEKVVDKFVKQ